ncbi:hypothetical protein [Methylobacter sp. S3L5C]|nr:hypothetical protein [Methylobacter sp. S3L5C]
MAALRNRVELVCAFDSICAAINSNFITLIEDYAVAEETSLSSR